VDKLQIGEVSQVVLMEDEKGEEAYRLLSLIKRTQPHRANLAEDYDQIQSWALQSKKLEIIKKWIEINSKNVFIKISDNYKNCNYQQKWF
jgi:peptidyl-prolyl cis-trans isomerase SurA